MTRPTLAQTLTSLAHGATPAHPGLTVTEAEINLPLVVAMEHGPDGPVFVAHPPASVYRTGFDPVAHRARLVLTEIPEGDTPDITAAPERAEQTATKSAGYDGVA